MHGFETMSPKKSCRSISSRPEVQVQCSASLNLPRSHPGVWWTMTIVLRIFSQSRRHRVEKPKIWMSKRDLRIGARVVLIRLNGSRGWATAHAEHGTKTCECHHQLITILALCIFCSDRSSRKRQLRHKLFTTMIPPGFFLKCGFELFAW